MQLDFLPLHRALVVELVLAVLDDGGDGLEREVAVSVLDHVLQIEILYREVVVAVFVRPAHGGIVGLAHFRAHAVLVGEIAAHRLDRAVDQQRRVVSLRAVERRVGLVL